MRLSVPVKNIRQTAMPLVRLNREKPQIILRVHVGIEKCWRSARVIYDLKCQKNGFMDQLFGIVTME